MHHQVPVHEQPFKCYYFIIVFNSYDQYQKCLRANTPRHIYSVPGGDIPSYGDRVAFCCQRLDITILTQILYLKIIIAVRDLPVKQFYSNTLLQRSRVRQTDEL